VNLCGGALLSVTALAVGVLAPRPQNVFAARVLSDGEAVLLAGSDKYKRVFGVGKVDQLGLLANVAGSFGVGHLVEM
jgi:hypothetical protein